MKEYKGYPASEGLAMGRLIHLERRVTGLSRIVQDPHRERALFDAATVLAKDELKQLEKKAEGDDKDIFLFQRVLLDDESLLNEVCDYIAAGAGSAAAVERAAEVFAARIGNVDDDYICQRSSDVMDACRRVVDILDGRPRQKLKLTEPSVLISDSYFPSDIVGVERGMVRGLVATAGSAQSHAAIISRTMNIPSLIQVGKEPMAVEDGTLVVVDAENGVLIVDPDEATVTTMKLRLQQAAVRKQEQQNAERPGPCTTRDGTHITILTNGSEPEDIEQAMQAGAEGVGLVRTEFLLVNGRIPSEEEQYYFYLSCTSAAEDKKVIFRTFDVGADKMVEGLTGMERNPALGLRGIRATLARPGMMEDQLCALLRVGARKDIRVMFPMVGDADEWDLCMERVEKAKKKLRERGVKFSEDLVFGCMIEVPSAALEAEELARRGAAFFSIGTNDLVQYTCAVDRMDEKLAYYYKTGSPAVHKLIAMTLEAARKFEIPVCVCGLAAADPDMAERLVRQGVRCLSMASQSMPKVRARLADVDLTEK